MNSILILNLDLINILGMFRTNTTDCSLWPGEEQPVLCYLCVIKVDSCIIYHWMCFCDDVNHNTEKI